MVREKPVLRRCLETLEARSADPVDADLAALCHSRGATRVYSFDQSLERLGLELLPVE
jgi:predicted nucleic acid-binding protein